MRRSTRSTLAASAVTLLLLAGCSSTGSGEEDATAAATDATGSAEAATPGDTAAPEDVAALEGVEVEGEPGSEPTVTFEQPLTVSAPVARVADPGDGEELVEGQLLTLDFVTVSGADGSTIGSTYGAEPESLVLGDAQVVPALTEALLGQNVGARVLFATPDAEGAAIMAIEVMDAAPARAQGEAVAPAEGLPTVTLAENGEPSLTPAEGEPPAELVVQPLIEGTGPVVESGQTVTMQYSGWLWDGTAFDSSWSKGSPFTTQIGVGQVIEGWDTGLVGQKVGSQVMLVIPPELGYGDTESGPIPAGSTLVFVVDILHAA